MNFERKKHTWGNPTLEIDLSNIGYLQDQPKLENIYNLKYTCKEKSWPLESM